MSTTMPKPEATVSTAPMHPLGALAGLAFVATFLVWLGAIFDAPMFTEPAAAIQQYLADGPVLPRVASYVGMVGGLCFLLPFVAAIATAIPRTAGRRWLAPVVVTAAGFSIVMLLLDAALGAATALIDPRGLSGPAMELLWNMSRMVNASFNHLGTGVWVAAASVALLAAAAVFPLPG